MSARRPRSGRRRRGEERVGFCAGPLRLAQAEVSPLDVLGFFTPKITGAHSAGDPGF